MDQHKKIIKETYAKASWAKASWAKASCGCGCSCNSGQSNEELAKSIGYSEDEIKQAPDANLGLGCGNPTALGEIKEGMTVVDLGSGGGFDCFLAAKKAKKVIGIDMTFEMIKKAEDNAKKQGICNVEFRQGEIENLPVKNNSADVVMSNCVINLSQDKKAVLKEANRILKKHGSLFISDIVLLGELTTEQKNDPKLISGCVGGAIFRDEFLNMIKEAGFDIISVSDDTDISKRQYNGLPVESIKLNAKKTKEA